MVGKTHIFEEKNLLYLEIADRIGNALCRDAFWDNDRCIWLGWGQKSQGNKVVPAFSACDADLYGGTSGIALFLTMLYQFTKDKQQLRAIEGAVNQALSNYKNMSDRLHHGFYSGVNGIAFSLIRIGEILQREELIKRGISIMQSLKYVPLDDKNIDVISGSAGAIPALLTIAKKYQQGDFLELAIAHGRHLIKLAEHGEIGCSWQTLGISGHANLTGYSHGTAGIATAFLELYEVTKDAEFLEVAISAFRYENNWFQKDELNWSDLRQDFYGNAKCSIAWCHGAPGIGLSRLRCRQLLPTNMDIHFDLEAALQSTQFALTQPWLPGKLNYSLCHGVAGNTELILKAALELNRPELMSVAEKVGQDGHMYYIKQGLPWPCGNRGIGHSPGLMLGTAGIGYFYLRLYDALCVPSILLITPN